MTARSGRLGLCLSGRVRRLLELGDSSLPGLQGGTIRGQRTVDGGFPSGVTLVGVKRAEATPYGCPQGL